MTGIRTWRPYSGNIIELCPVGALTSQPYRFRARPWDNESSAGICTLCPSQCNVTLTVRDDRVMRVLARDYEGNAGVDDGWLCDKGRFAYQAMQVDDRITRPLVRDGGELREVSWERAIETAAGLARHRGRVGALVGGQATNEEGYLLQRLMRERLDSSDIDSRGPGALPNGTARALAAPELQASIPDVEFAHTVLLLGCDPREDASILDLRLRKGIRRQGVKLAVATARPTALDPSAAQITRIAPGGEAEFAVALDRALAGATDVADDVAAVAGLLTENGGDVVIVYGDRIGAAAASALRRIAGRLGMADTDGAGLLEIPAGSNGRGLREAGAVPDAGPGYEALETPGRGAAEIGAATAAGELTALYLFGTDPVRDLPNRGLWEQALHSAALVVAHASVLTEGLREHATVIFPAESYAEKEGTVTHPDGRLQRLRIAIAHPDEVRAGWSVIAEVSRRCGLDLQIETGIQAFEQLAGSVPGLPRPDAGGDRRARPALAGAPGGAPDGAVHQSCRRGAARPRTRGHPAGARVAGTTCARHLPPALGRAGGRDLPGPAVPGPAPDRRALARRLRAPGHRRRRPGHRGPERHAAQRPRRDPLHRPVPGGRSWPRAWRPIRPTRSPGWAGFISR